MEKEVIMILVDIVFHKVVNLSTIAQ
jgi:hypothetical protein